MPRAYAITAEAIAEERKRVGDDLEKFDVSRVIALDDAVVREVGPRDVHLRILAVSAEHNVDPLNSISPNLFLLRARRSCGRLRRYPPGASLCRFLP